MEEPENLQIDIVSELDVLMAAILDKTSKSEL